MTQLEEILKRVDELVETEFVTTEFGNHWKEHAKEHYDIDELVNIAWKQGRRAILLENALKELVGF